jgi:ferredoxin-NADP reductase
MASSPQKTDSFELIIEIVSGGAASDYLMRINPGDTLTTQGPAGQFTLRPPSRPIIFLATGTGIAPIKSMILDLLEHQQTVQSLSLFWGFPVYDDTYLFPVFHQLHQQYPNFSFCNCLSRELDLSCIPEQDNQSFYALGHVQDAVSTKITNPLTEYDFYLCGGPKVVDALKEWTLNQGVPTEQVHFEKFTA